jgi:hypothetical protein
MQAHKHKKPEHPTSMDTSTDDIDSFSLDSSLEKEINNMLASSMGDALSRPVTLINNVTPEEYQAVLDNVACLDLHYLADCAFYN